MKKNEIRLLVSAALLMGIAIYYLGIVNAMTGVFYAALMTLITMLVMMFVRAIRDMKGGVK